MIDMKLYGKKYWDGVPDELKYMCLAQVRGSGSYCVKPVLCYLLDHLDDCDYFVCDTTAYDIIKWIDIAMDSCLFPIELHDEDWINNRESIYRLLKRSEELLQKAAPADYKEGYRIPGDVIRKYNFVEYAQNLNIYFSVLYLFDEDEKNLRERLEMSVEDSKRNLEYLKTCQEYESYKGTNMIEPIRRLKHEYLPDGEVSEGYYEIYRRYLSEIGESKEE